ncbi:hypothetical protein FPV67DRAFT_1705482 [Lyophyllum atratum]|nr:hypothetical protein FPV67DRAFT_1705482 [Lyophyllum atratum]
MRFASLMISALVALTALAAPLPTEKGTAAAGTLQPNVISHQPQPPPAPLQGRGPKPIVKAATKAAALAVPSVQEMKSHLSISPNKVLFYSGPGGYIDLARKKAASMGLRILEDSWKDKKFPDKYQAGLGPAEMQKFWDNASQALAQASSGTVHVLLPADTVGTNFFKGAIWARIEWGALQRNGAVTKVIKINPDNKEEEVIKGAGAGAHGAAKSSRPPSRGKSPARGSAKQH